MPLTHWLPSRGPKPISLVFRHSPCLNLQWPSKTFIHPPRMTMTDLATKRSICIPLSFFFFSLPLLSFSLWLLHFILLLFCWCAEYDEKVRVQVALTPWHVRVTMQSLFDLGKQLIRVSIYLYFWHVTFYFGGSLQIIHANIQSFTCSIWFCRLVDLWHSEPLMFGIYRQRDFLQTSL